MTTIYGTFIGQINQESFSNIVQNLTAAHQNGVTSLHIMFQSDGGMIADGIALYNFLKIFPAELHLYNSGAVQSVAVVSYLGAKRPNTKLRHVSQHGIFMLHKTAATIEERANAARLKAAATACEIGDTRTEAILQTANIPEDRWRTYAFADVFFNAQEAIDFGIADDICEFQVPAGNQIFNLNAGQRQR
jgi:ATP-dependent protease ClpP protease subunit